MTNHLGCTLQFNGPGLSNNTRIYQEKIIPAWQEIAEAYNELFPESSFSQESYEEISEKGLRLIKTQYNKNLESERRNLKSPMLAKRILDKEVSPFTQLDSAWDQLNAVIGSENTALHSILVNTAFLNYDQKKGEFVIDQEKMHEAFEDKIDSAEMNEAYCALLEFQEAHIKLQITLKRLLPKERIPIIPGGGDQGDQLIYEEFGKTQIDLSYFVALFN
jgi:hypothetical protein